MELIRLFADADPAARKDVLVTALLSSAAGATLLGLINSASEIVAQHKSVPIRSLLLYLVAFAICYLGNRTSLLSAYEMMETALQKVRLRIAGKICRARLRDIDILGRGELFTTLAEGTNHLSQVTPALVAGLQQGLLVVGCLVYIATLSAAGFLVMAGITVLAGGFFLRLRQAHHGLRQELASSDARLLDSLAGFVDGFKELRLNQRKSDALQHSFQNLAEHTELSKLRLGDTWTVATLFTNLYLYKMLAILVFVLPVLVSGVDQSLVKLATASLFLLGPISTVVNVLPSVEQAESGLRALVALEERLDKVVASEDPVLFEKLDEIRVTDATFRYFHDGEVSFTSGPWSLTVKPGEVIFLVGGNGSGKSTALKMLTGLYPLASGSIEVNGVAVKSESELFGGVFADFHLFDRLYGLEQVDPEVVRAWLERMGLADKVRFEDGRFTNLALSTGQRKRLALIAALLEDRPVYVFDEWAADQDKHFRDEFYLRILPELKARNKAVIVVTHDDRYWHLADRVVRLESGRML